MINVGIVGGSGYTAEELIGMLLRHPDVRISGVFSRSAAGKNVSSVYPQFAGRINLVMRKPEVKAIADSCDLVFLALPHTVSMEFVPGLLKLGKKVIDLSADYRLKDHAEYEKFYEVKHKDKLNLTRAVYGIPELRRNTIKNAKFIANPGCYPTVSILALAPLVGVGLIDLESIIIDAKSGVSGAGRRVAEGFLFTEINEDFKAYKVGTHQHSPEINQELGKLAGKKLKVTFVPHLLPVNRGILATIYVKKDQRSKIKDQKLGGLYKRFYKNEPFVRIREEGDFPRLRDVVNTNFCDIGIKVAGENIIIIAAIDNLLKGACGQAVQNMNIMYDYQETAGLL